MLLLQTYGPRRANFTQPTMFLYVVTNGNYEYILTIFTGINTIENDMVSTLTITEPVPQKSNPASTSPKCNLISGAKQVINYSSCAFKSKFQTKN